MIAARASLIEFPGSRNRVTYGGYGQLSCVREQESPCVLRIVALAVLPRRFPVLWFVHTWWLQSAAAAALTIGATHSIAACSRHVTLQCPPGDSSLPT